MVYPTNNAIIPNKKFPGQLSVSSFFRDIVEAHGWVIVLHVQGKLGCKVFLYPINWRAQTSIGLSLGYDIVKAHSGDLHVESEEEQGRT